jgi:hypothetical protein
LAGPGIAECLDPKGAVVTLDLLDHVAQMFSPQRKVGGMNETSGSRQSSGFSRWLRTGRLPSVLSPDGLELKFNPWHDPADGRFTFAGTGVRQGARGGASLRIAHIPVADDRNKRPTATPAKAEAPRAGHVAGVGNTALVRRSSRLRPKRVTGVRPDDPSNPVAEFAGGVGEGLYDVGKGTVMGVHAALTTHPATTIRNAGRGIAGMIDAAIIAEDTPARIQISRAANSVANATARDIGRTTGSVTGNVALAVAPGAALSKIAAVRRLRLARPRMRYDPPQIGWVKETTRSEKPWKLYNDTAVGSRPGQAPTLMRTMPNGSKRPVKFDGFQGDYMIDRKWKVVNAPRARGQLLRQSAVLAEHRLIGIWEVPTQVQKTKALKMFKEKNVTNIHVRVVKPW